MNNTSLWTRDFLLVTLTNFFVSLNFYLLMVIISMFAMETFHSTPSGAGLATGIFVIGALFARMFAGRWMERIGRKRVLFAGLFLGTAASLLYFWLGGVMQLLAVRFIHGAAFGIASTATATIVAGTVQRERIGEGLGYYALSVTIATAAGPFLGMFISQHGSYPMLFTAAVIADASALAAAVFLSVPGVSMRKEHLEEMKGFKLSSFFEPRVIPISIVCAAIYFSYSSVLSFFTVYSREIDLVGPASFFFIVIAAVIFISRPFTGRLFDTRGENLLMYPAFLVFTAGMTVLGFTHHGYTLFLAGALIGLGLGVVQSCCQAITVKLSAAHRLGLANSTFFICLDLTVGIGPYLIGLLIPLTGYRGLYMVMAFVALACSLLYHLLHGGKAVREAGR